MFKANKVIFWAMALLLALCSASAALATESELPASPPEPETVVILPEVSLPVYSLTFLDDDDTVLLQESLIEGDIIIEPSLIPERDGFFFLFWYDVNAFERTLSYEPFAFDGAIYESILLKALYEEIPVIVVEEDAPTELDPEAELHPDLSNLPETLENGSLVLEELPQLGEVDMLLIEDPNGTLEVEEELEFSPVGNCGILIFSSHEDCVEEGATIDLWAELIGFENLEADFQWQYSADGGLTWSDVPGATGLTHSFIADPDTINWGWRLSATLEEI